MSLIHRMSEPVRTPVRRFTNHYAIFFEDLIHAVKNEMVDQVDHVGRHVENADRSLHASYEAIADQLAVQTTTLRTLTREVERLQQLIAGGGLATDDDMTDPIVDLIVTGGQKPAAPTKPMAGSSGEAESHPGSSTGKSKSSTRSTNG